MSSYQFEEAERQAQDYWEQNNCFAADNLQQPRFYCLSMFPYPSGKLHMGHVRNYSIGDAIARQKRMRGYNVLQPMGWDAFGLPAENAAIAHRTLPEQWTRNNIATMRQQLKRLGFAYDWQREFATCDPAYYKWEQWFFLQLFKRGIAYRAESEVNWDPVDQTVLANEQVVDGRGWRSGAIVERRRIMQWQLRISDYAEELLAGLDDLEGWPAEVRTMQKNWIGRSEGISFDFQLQGGEQPIKVFTTRPDTLMGATFVAIAPQHPLLDNRAKLPEQLQDFIQRHRQGSVSETNIGQLEKEGMDTGLKAIHPLSGEELPVWVANFVLMSYGTGAIMCVPAHDERDYEFANKYQLPVKQVVNPVGDNDHASTDSAFTEQGILVNSGIYDGLNFEEACQAIGDDLVKKASGQQLVRYRLRDWSISRQRCWGTPIPIIYCDNCGIVAVPEEQLPVELPIDLMPGEQGSSLANLKSYVETQCPDCGRPAKRETDTFDTFVESSWYYARFTCVDSDKAMLNAQADSWLPVDQYIGGIEHAVLHLLYARFFHRLMRDAGLVGNSEPFANLLTQGMVLKDGHKMSKSKGNTVDPDILLEQHGADALRLCTLFAAPPDKTLDWSDDVVVGARRFLSRLWKLARQQQSSQSTPDVFSKQARSLRIKTHQTIEKVTRDFEQRIQFNTAIAAVMELCNAVSNFNEPGPDADFVRYEALCSIVLMLAPITPHICHLLWQKLGGSQPVHEAPWPEADPEWLQEEQIEVILQVNGRTRGKFMVPSSSDAAEIETAALQSEPAQRHLAQKTLSKVIVVKNKLCNLVVK